MIIKKPPFTDAFYNTYFAVGGAIKRAAGNGAIESSLYNDYQAYFTQIDQGMGLTLWCYLVEAEFGDRNRFIEKLSDSDDRDIVQQLFYARNAFVHCGWDISKLNARMGQEQKIRDFVEAGGTHKTVKVFKMSIDGDNLLRLENVLNICHMLNQEATKDDNPA